MKKKILGAIIVGGVIIGIGGAIIYKNTLSSGEKLAVTKIKGEINDGYIALARNDIQSLKLNYGNSKTQSEVEKLRLDLNNKIKSGTINNKVNGLAKGKYLVGKVGSRRIFINLKDAEIKGNIIYAKANHSTDSKQVLTMEISQKTDSQYTFVERYKDKILGVYNVTLEGNEVKGTFKDSEDSKSYNVTLTLVKENNQKDSDKMNGTPTIGDIENVITQKVLLKGESITDISPTQGTTYLQEVKNHEKINYKQFKGQYLVTWLDPGANQYIGNFSSEKELVGQANYIINGEKAWAIKVQGVTVLYSGSKGYSIVVIGANGKVYNNEELYEAAKSNNITEVNVAGDYNKITISQMRENMKLTNTVITDDGACDGILTSVDNPEKVNWKPEN